MRDHQYREDGRPEDLLQELGYETQDIQYGKFARYGVFFLAFFLLMIVSGFLIMFLMTSTKLSGGRTVDYTPKTQAPPSTPLLQTNITARTDIRSLRMKETEALTTPAVKDERHGSYRIPIDQAIELTAERGLPKTAPMPSGGTSTQQGQPRQGFYSSSIFIPNESSFSHTRLNPGLADAGSATAQPGVWGGPSGEGEASPEGMPVKAVDRSGRLRRLPLNSPPPGTEFIKPEFAEAGHSGHILRMKDNALATGKNYLAPEGGKGG